MYSTGFISSDNSVRCVDASTPTTRQCGWPFQLISWPIGSRLPYIARAAAALSMTTRPLAESSCAVKERQSQCALERGTIDRYERLRILRALVAQIFLDERVEGAAVAERQQRSGRGDAHTRDGADRVQHAVEISVRVGDRAIARRRHVYMKRHGA